MVRNAMKCEMRFSISAVSAAAVDATRLAQPEAHARRIDDDALHRKALKHMRCAGPEELNETLCAAKMDQECGLLFSTRKNMGVPEFRPATDAPARRRVGGQLRECGGGRQLLGHGRRQR